MRCASICPIYHKPCTTFWWCLKRSLHPCVTWADLWDWHIYTHPQDMFNKRNEFNGRTPQNSHYIFASEYAVTEGGGWGNLIGKHVAF